MMCVPRRFGTRLGIVSSDEAEGRYHEIKVKLAGKRKGLTVRHRGGYRSKSQESRVREELLRLVAQNPTETRP